MTARAARIERIRVLLEERRHPERRVRIFSATNLTRVALRFATMGLAAATVQALLGDGPPALLAAGVAVAVADEAATRLWRRIGRGVQQAWRVVGAAAAALVLVVLLATVLSPRVADAVGGGLNRWVEDRRAALDRSAAEADRIPIDPAAAVDARWELLLDQGALLVANRAEAAELCAAKGPAWTLPPGLGAWPELDRYPTLGTTVHVWSLGGSVIQIGTGGPPSAAVTSSGRASEMHGVLCLEGL